MVLQHPTGIHVLPADEYHALDLCSASRLSEFARSPAHCRYAIDHPRKSAAMDLGTAIHACVLDPETFAVCYALGPHVDLRTKAGTAEWAAFVAANPGKVLLRGADGMKLVEMHQAVWNHPASRRMLEAAGAWRELTVIWKHKLTGLLCKSRFDYVYNGIIVDLKSTGDASPNGFASALERYGYHRQAAFYLRALAAVGEPADVCCLIAVESEPPHAVAVYRLDDDDLGAGDAENEALMPRYAECVHTGIWPGYGDTLETIRRPRWARTNHQGE